jgi:cellulose synthase/poly-beta-1,6-N-acetylglucosamine synthase-like glycosyltransferase
MTMRMDTWESILAVWFWCSAAIAVYTYLGYPVLLYALSRVFGAPPSPPRVATDDLPRVSLLIAAHNEAAVIEERIRNAAALSYPHGRAEIVIASDGSDDATLVICARYTDSPLRPPLPPGEEMFERSEDEVRVFGKLPAGPATERSESHAAPRQPPGNQVRVLAFPKRRGKAATLNAAVPQLDTDIIVFSDANTMMEPSALLNLARWFVDPHVGAVCGRLVLRDPGTGRNADSLYWRYETFLKRCEGRLGGLLGANGGIYAIRRGLFSPLPPDTAIDDFVIPLMAKLASGCRIVYDPQAVAHEETAPSVGSEFRRRVRIGVGGWQALSVLWPLLAPRHGWTPFTFLSHKVLRWACPFFLLSALASALVLCSHPMYAALLLIQAAFYISCAIGAVIPPSNRLCRAWRILPLFIGMNAALFIGIVRGLRGGQASIWTRTARSQDGPAPTQ